MSEVTLALVYLETVKLLEVFNLPYMIVGGLAVGIQGEQRLTNDIDVDIIIREDQMKEFLSQAKQSGFTYQEEEISKRVTQRGVFRLNYESFYVDFIISSTKFEESAFNRRQKITLYKIPAYFPSPEDLTIMKLIAGRGKDLLDVESIMIRHKDKLDLKYLDKWIKQVADESEDITIWNRYQAVLKEVYKS
ncbi:MAG: DUF6036 family nucleotidyltransferase [Planctomycetota bacterium]